MWPCQAPSCALASCPVRLRVQRQLLHGILQLEKDLGRLTVHMPRNSVASVGFTTQVARVSSIVACPGSSEQLGLRSCDTAQRGPRPRTLHHGLLWDWLPLVC